MINNEFKIRIKKLVDEYLKPLEIQELDLDIIPTLTSQKTGKKFSTQYLNETKRIGKYFNTFYRRRKDLMIFLDILHDFLRYRSGKISEHTYYIQANALKGLIMNQPKIQQQDEYFKQIFETVVKDICFDKDLLDNCKEAVPRSEPHPLPKERLTSLLKNANSRTEHIISFMLMSGCNVQELVRITLKEVMQLSIDDAVIVTLASNSKQQRTAVVSRSMLLSILEEFHGTSRMNTIPEESYLFQTKSGTALIKNNVYIMIEKAGQTIGIDKLNVADLYETSRMIKRMGGCSDIEETHLEDAELNNASTQKLIQRKLDCFAFLNDDYANQNKNPSKDL